MEEDGLMVVCGGGRGRGGRGGGGGGGLLLTKQKVHFTFSLKEKSS